MAEMLRTKEMAERLGVAPVTLNQWGLLYGCPNHKKYFRGGSGHGGLRGGTGWDPGCVIAWLDRTRRRNEHGELINAKTGELIPKYVPSPPPEEGDSAPLGAASMRGMPGIALARLLAAFAAVCEYAGMPHRLQELLDAADLDQLSPDALQIIEEMALRHPKTEAAWILIKSALPVLLGRAKPDKSNGKELPIKITIQAGPDLADKIVLKVIGYNTPDPGKG